MEHEVSVLWNKCLPSLISFLLLFFTMTMNQPETGDHEMTGGITRFEREKR